MSCCIPWPEPHMVHAFPECTVLILLHLHQIQFRHKLSAIVLLLHLMLYICD